MDYEYWLRLGLAGVRFGRIDRKLAGSRMHAQNKTLSQTARAHGEASRMLHRRTGRVPDRRLLAYAFAATEHRIDRAAHPIRFEIEAGLRSVIESIRWNRSISPEMRKRIAGRLLRRL